MCERLGISVTAEGVDYGVVEWVKTVWICDENEVDFVN